MDVATRFYDHVFTYGDPRVVDWPLMRSPWQLLALVVAYVYFVKVQGPAWMKDRKPMNLRVPMIIYNFGMMFVNFLMVAEAGALSWFRDYNWICQPVDTSDDPRSHRMAVLGWWYLLTRFMEYMDTIFFVLRKKDNQVSTLHVFHHSTVPIVTWITLKHAPGGHHAFAPFINGGVHVIMYTYYGLAAFGDITRKYLWWKKYLTTVQMVQFVMIVLHGAVPFFYDCGVPWTATVAVNFATVLYFVMFYQFYQEAYIRNSGHIKRKSNANGDVKHEKAQKITSNGVTHLRTSKPKSDANDNQICQSPVS